VKKQLKKELKELADSETEITRSEFDEKIKGISKKYHTTLTGIII
jgi:hypothetical protein